MNHEITDLFNKLAIACYSFSKTDTNKLLLYKGACEEHDFRCFVTDSATVIEYNLNDKDTYCAINFPYVGLLYEHVVQLLLESSLKEIDRLGGYYTTVSKFDVTKDRWETIREYLDLLNNIAAVLNKPIHIGLEANWLSSHDNLNKFFSLVDANEHIFPVITCYSKIESVTFSNLMKWAFIAKSSSIKPVSYFGPPPSNPEFLLALLNEGFDCIGIPPQIAIELITST